MKKMLGKKETMERWVSDVPALTVVHLGACDIGNKDIYIKVQPLSQQNSIEKALSIFWTHGLREPQRE